MRDLTAANVRVALRALAADHSTDTVSMARLSLERAIRHAEASGLVRRNVAALVDAPEGQAGRPSRSLTPGQAEAMVRAAQAGRLCAYVLLSLMTGVRTEEARALLWDHVVAWIEEDGCWLPVSEAGWDSDQFAIYVWRSVRGDGDAKTERSRRTLALPAMVAGALRQEWEIQQADRCMAGSSWQENGLVFCSSIGTKLDAANVRRKFKAVCEAAGIGRGWTPRELRHTFVSQFGGRHEHGGDRAPGRPCLDGRHGTDLPEGTAASPARRRRGHGPQIQPVIKRTSLVRRARIIPRCALVSANTPSTCINRPRMSPRVAR